MRSLWLRAPTPFRVASGYRTFVHVGRSRRLRSVRLVRAALKVIRCKGLLSIAATAVAQDAPRSAACRPSTSGRHHSRTSAAIRTARNRAAGSKKWPEIISSSGR